MLLNFTKPLLKSLSLICQKMLICGAVVRVPENAIADSHRVSLMKNFYFKSFQKSTFVILFWDRIVTAAPPRMTAENTLYCQPTALEKSMFF